MSLTPKNWVGFQHYKDRKPPWIKLHHGLLDDYEFSRLPLASRALAPFLWLLASEYEGGKITASLDEIAYRMRISTEELRGALNPLIDRGFFVASGALAYCEPDAMPEKERETQEEAEEETEHCAVATAPRTKNEDFENFWKAYPKRQGSNPKHPAEKLFVAAVKAGEDPKAIIGGAARYRADPATKVGTEFVMQAVRWLRNRCWQDYPRPTATNNGEAVNGHWIAFDSPEWTAWTRHNGKPFPHDKKGGWVAPSQWPPGCEFAREPDLELERVIE